MHSFVAEFNKLIAMYGSSLVRMDEVPVMKDVTTNLLPNRPTKI